MVINRKHTFGGLVPLALAGALLLSGCSTTDSTLEAPGDVAAVENNESSTPESALYDSTQDNLDAAPADAAEALRSLSAELDQIDGINGVGISYYGPEVDLGVVIPVAGDGTNVSAEQLKKVLSTIEKHDYPATVEGFTINVWGADGFGADSSLVGQEIGLKDEFNDSEWGWIKFSVKDLGSLYK